MTRKLETQPTSLADLKAGHRRSLAIALSLIESNKESDQLQARTILDHVTAEGTPTHCQRIAISGAPGVGKSSIIEVLGLRMVEAGQKIAVLTVDPTSQRTGGSILADKVRMPKLSSSEHAFVRPSASRTSIGGVNDTMRDAITLCEYAGYDTVIVETVGVGQNEIAASSMVDLFVLLMLPTAGDEMQGIKRGIMEVCDLLVIAKSDLDAMASQRAQSLYRGALRFMLPTRKDWGSPVVTASSVDKHGCDALADAINSFFTAERWPAIQQERKIQRVVWFNELFNHLTHSLLLKEKNLEAAITLMRTKVAEGQLHPRHSVNELLRQLHITYSPEQ